MSVLVHSYTIIQRTCYLHIQNSCFPIFYNTIYVAIATAAGASRVTSAARCGAPTSPRATDAVTSGQGARHLIHKCCYWPMEHLSNITEVSDQMSLLI
jgi:hypothetical protein